MLITALLIGLCMVLMAVPAPVGLQHEGQRVLAVAVLAIGLWCTDAMPAGVTGVLVILALVLGGGVPGLQQALVEFANNL
jgi:di/tricarboxylate transporter